MPVIFASIYAMNLDWPSRLFYELLTFPPQKPWRQAALRNSIDRESLTNRGYGLR